MPARDIAAAPLWCGPSARELILPGHARRGTNALVGYFSIWENFDAATTSARLIILPGVVMRFTVQAAQPIKFEAKLEGGHTLLASLWFDEQNSAGWWHVEPDAVRPGETEWDLGAPAESFSLKVQAKHEYDARGPHRAMSFAPFKSGDSLFFWLELSVASNTNAALKNAVVDLELSQNDQIVEPDVGASAVLLANKKGAKVLIGYEYIELALR